MLIVQKDLRVRNMRKKKGENEASQNINFPFEKFDIFIFKERYKYMWN
jgi:hypothetical protein